MDETIELVERTKAGDAGAFTELMRRYQDAAFACAVSILHDFHLAQDVTQEAFLIAHRRIAALVEPRAFPGWLRGIVRHRCHRVLRRAAVLAVPLDNALSLAAPVPEPWRLMERQESAQQVLRALAALPMPQREVLTLAYVRDYPQAQIAAFLGVPVSTVNNRLHAARRSLQERVLTMVQEALHEHGLPDDFAQRVGRIARVEGPVVDARFPPANVPEIFDPVNIEGGQLAGAASVVQRRPDGSVRCVATAPVDQWRAGMRLSTLAEGRRVGRVSDAGLDQAVRLLAPRLPEPPAVLETGIKVIDVLCPLVAGGSVGIFAAQGVGRVVLVQELIKRLAGGPVGVSVLCFSAPGDVSAIQDMLTAEEGYPGDVTGAVQVFWLTTDLATDPVYAAQAPGVDAAIYLSPLPAVHGLWPAVDGLIAHSRLLAPGLLDAEHIAVAGQIRQELRRAAELMCDPILLEHLALGAHRLARQRAQTFAAQRMAELAGEELVTVQRARRLQRYFTQPFFVAETFTGMRGQSVPRHQAVRDCADILAGRYDDVPEEAFLCIGAAHEARGQPD